MNTFKRYLATVIVFLMGLSLSHVLTTFAHGGDEMLIHACVKNNTGALRIIAANDTCGNNESPLDWKIQGEPGLIGPQGPAGPQGLPGPSYNAGNGLSLTENEFSVSDGGITTPKLADGSVTTAKLATGAVTQFQSVSSSQRFDFPDPLCSNDWMDVPGQSITLTTTGAPVLVMSSANYLSEGGAVFVLRIIRDGGFEVTRFHEGITSGVGRLGHFATTFFGVDVPPAGIHTYKLQGARRGCGGFTIAANLWPANFAAIEFKR